MAPTAAPAAATAAKGGGDEGKGEVRLENEWATLHIWLQGAACPTHHHHHHHHHHHEHHHHTGGPRFSFVSKANPELGIFDTSLVEFNGKVRGKPWRATLAKAAVRVEETEVERSGGLREFGPKALTLATELPEVGKVFVDFALSTTGPRMILRLRCPAMACADADELRLEEFVLFDGDCEVSRGPRKPGGRGLVKAVWDYFFRAKGARRVFVNGWNAWSFTGAVQQGDRPPAPGLPGVFSAAFHHGAGSAAFDRGSKELYSEMFALLSDKGRGSGLLLGFLSQHEQFGAFSFDPAFVEVGAHCRCDGQLLKRGAALASDWCLIELQPALPEEPLSEYMDRAARVSHDLVAAQDAEPVSGDIDNVPVGWCSWYHFYENISETNLQDNIAMMAKLRDKLPLQLFQIDDGYQRAWGDWLTLDGGKFPTKSMRDLVKIVRAQGLRPGLWLAPVAVDKHSRVAAEHPEWIIRQAGDPLGRAANSANCGKWFYGLDVTIPEVQAFIRHTLATVSHGAWSFDYLKLDFLYAAALKGPRRDPTLSTAQVLQLAMRLIRHAVGPGTFVLGCGAPLGATIGWVNANRVSADAGPAWLPSFPLPDCKWNLPCGRNMVRNTINRLPMHGRWWVNDPDCMLLREATQFTPAEVIGIATVKALSGGSFLVSDDLSSVSRPRLRVAQAMLPVTGRAAVALDLLESEMPEVLRLALDSTCASSGSDTYDDAWVLVALCNWTDTRKDTTHPWAALLRPLLASGRPHPQPLRLHVLEFWTSQYFSARLDLDATPAAAMDTRQFGPDGAAAGGARGAGGVLPHSARLYAVRVDRGGGQPQYVGADVHFSCGRELTRFAWQEVQEAEGSSSAAAAAAAAAAGGGGGKNGGGGSRKRKRRVMEVRVALDAGKVVEGGQHHIWLQLPGSERAAELQGEAGAERVAAAAVTYEKPHHLPHPHLPHLPQLRTGSSHSPGKGGGGGSGVFGGLGRRKGGEGEEEEGEDELAVRTVWKVPFPSETARTFEWTLRYELD